MATDRLLQTAGRVLAGVALAGTLSFTAAAQDGYAVPDAQLQRDVGLALHNDAKLNNISITAKASQGTITLTGTVANEDMRAEAEQAVAGVSGVRSIQDNLNVTETGAPAAGTVAQGNEAPPPPDELESSQTNAPALPPPPPPDTAQSGTSAPVQPGAQVPDWGTRGNAHVPSGYSAPAPGLPQAQAAPVPAQPVSGPVTLPEGTLVNVRLSEPLSTGPSKPGDYFQSTAASDVYIGGVLAIPRGATLAGQVVEAKNAGALGGSPRLELRLTSLQLGENSYGLDSDVWSSHGPSKNGYTATNAIGGAATGAVIGALAGGGLGAGVGALAGGATGTLISGATHGPRLDLPPEALLQFHLAAPLTIQPVPYVEAARLASAVPVPPAPVLRVRPVYVAAPYPYYVRPYPYLVRPYRYYYGRF